MIRKCLLLLLALVTMPVMAQREKTVYIDSLHVAQCLALDSGQVAVPIQADSDSIEETVLPDADLSNPWVSRLRRRMANVLDQNIFKTTHMGVMIWDLDDDVCVYRHDETQRMRPASVMKCVTAISALDQLGCDYEFSTKLYYKGTIAEDSVLHGSLYVVGGMDPLLGSRNVQAFVDSLKHLGVQAITGDLLADKSMKDTRPMGSGWCWDDDDSNPNMSPLLYERKDMFMGELRRRLQAAGIRVQGEVGEGLKPSGAHLVADERHALTDVMTRMMKRSDNLHAESVFYQMAKSTGIRNAGARQARLQVNKVIRKTGLNPSNYYIADGCGLSLYDYVSAEMVTRLLRLAYKDNAIYRALLPTMPIAGRDGTLQKRMRGTAAADNVHAKTGTVTSVSSLAGYCTASNGHHLCFTIINQGAIHAWQVRTVQDQICQIMCE